MRAVLLLAACCAIALAGAGAGAAPAAGAGNPPSATCSPGSCSGWHTSPVRVTWTVDPSASAPSCGPVVVSTDTTGQKLQCDETFPDGSGLSAFVTIELDGTPPTVSGLKAARDADVGGWYNHPVEVSASGTDATSGIESCTSTTYSGPDSGSASLTGTCRDRAGNVSAPATLSLRYDGTAPSVQARADRAPDANGWYDKPVSISGDGSDGGSGIDSCSSASYSGPDTGSATVTVSCSDKAGNTGSATATIAYDATPPSAQAAPSRPPDANGWYNHPVDVAFSGTDATSGVAACTTVTYSGPQSANATVTGTCTDKAGNTSAQQSFALKYDATPPALADVQALPAKDAATLTWQGSTDTKTIEILRTPGLKGAKTSVVYHGRAKQFRDTRVRQGVRYRYTVVGIDIAGNRRTLAISVRVVNPILAPRDKATVRRAPTLRWRPVRGASYYNVQLFRGSTKVLTAWPTAARLALKTSWSYVGSLQRLKPGSYRWYVWPGRGSPSRHVYGALLGAAHFTVVS